MRPSEAKQGVGRWLGRSVAAFGRPSVSLFFAQIDYGVIFLDFGPFCCCCKSGRLLRINQRHPTYDYGRQQDQGIGAFYTLHTAPGTARGTGSENTTPTRSSPLPNMQNGNATNFKYFIHYFFYLHITRCCECDLSVSACAAWAGLSSTTP